MSSKTMWKPKHWRRWPEEKSSAIFCNRWRCCPRDWNREHPEDPITRAQWRKEQGHIDRLFRRTEETTMTEAQREAWIQRQLANAPELSKETLAQVSRLLTPTDVEVRLHDLDDVAREFGVDLSAESWEEAYRLARDERSGAE